MKTDNPSLKSYRLSVASRVIAAALGGYVLVNLSALTLSFILPVEQYKGLLFGMMTSFLYYTLVVIWVFSVRTATRAWLGLIVVALPLLVINLIFYFQGAAI